jgi:hypothetical protein
VIAKVLPMATGLDRLRAMTRNFAKIRALHDLKKATMRSSHLMMCQPCRVITSSPIFSGLSPSKKWNQIELSIVIIPKHNKRGPSG